MMYTNWQIMTNEYLHRVNKQWTPSVEDRLPPGWEEQGPNCQTRTSASKTIATVIHLSLTEILCIPTSITNQQQVYKVTNCKE